MKYTLTTQINAPLDRVVELFLDTANLAKWQPSLVTFTPLTSGDPNQIGAQSKQLHRMGQREVEMIATITQMDPPHRFAATYESGDMWNEISNLFEEGDKGSSTHWSLTSEMRSTNLMMKAFMLFAPGMFRQQTQDFMGYFKTFVEESK